jgi:hypothetical protein
VGHTTRRDRALSTHRPAIAAAGAKRTFIIPFLRLCSRSPCPRLRLRASHRIRVDNVDNFPQVSEATKETSPYFLRVFTRIGSANFHHILSASGVLTLGVMRRGGLVMMICSRNISLQRLTQRRPHARRHRHHAGIDRVDRADLSVAIPQDRTIQSECRRQLSYLNESATRVRNAVTLPSSTFMSICVTSATRKSRSEPADPSTK